MNRETLIQLSEAVALRLHIVADHSLRDADPVAHLGQLKAASARLDELIAVLPKATDPMLRHYLERQSYVKAKDWLDAAISND